MKCNVFFVSVTFGFVVGELMVGQTEPALLEVLDPKAVPPLRPLDHHPAETITKGTLSMPRRHYIHHGHTMIRFRMIHYSVCSSVLWRLDAWTLLMVNRPAPHHQFKRLCLFVCMYVNYGNHFTSDHPWREGSLTLWSSSRFLPC